MRCSTCKHLSAIAALAVVLPGGSTTATSLTATTGATTGAAVAADDGLLAAVGDPIVMVVGNAAAPGTNDELVRDRLSGLGHAVTLVDDDFADGVVADDAAFVLLSSSIDSSTVGASFRDTARPVWVAKPWSLDDMAMTGPVANSDYGLVTTSGATVVDAQHPLAAGRTGIVQVTSRNRGFSYGRPANGATVVTTAAGLPSTFVYPAGAKLADGSTSIGCRLHLPALSGAPSSFTAQGWALFDAAVGYLAAGCATGGVDAPPVVSITEPAPGDVVRGAITIAVDAADEAGVTNVAFAVDGTSLGVDSDGGDGWWLHWDTASSPDGSASLTVSATDTTGQTTSTSVVVTVDNSTAPGPKVILISVDGLRPDVVSSLGPVKLPAFHRLIAEGASTHNARTVRDATQTLPNHTSVLTALPVAGASGHGVDFNEDDGLTVHDAAGRYVPSVFDVAHDNGLGTSLFAGKSKFDFFVRSWNSTHGAPDVTGDDDGADKIDYDEEGDGGPLTTSFVSEMTRALFDLSLVHFSAPDAAGHAFGWQSAGYEQAVRDVDGWLAQIMDLVTSDPALAGRTTIVLTADHGGSGTSHADESLALNYTIPLYVWGPDIAAGADLYARNAATRRDPGTGRPGHEELPQPIRNADVANLALDLLGLGPVPGSTINAVQDLDVAAGAPVNRPPVVDAGPDRDLRTTDLPVALDATVTDDGLPTGALDITWSQVSGPLGAGFEPPDAAATTVTLPGSGTYVLRLAADDGSGPVADDVTVVVRDGAPLVALIAGTAPPPPGDRVVRDRLVAAGVEVTEIDDDDLPAVDLSGFDAVFVATSIAPAKVGGALRALTVPVVGWEPYIFADMGLGPSGETTTLHTRLTIADVGSELAAGLAGSPWVYTRAGKLSYARVARDAEVIAHEFGRPDRAVIFRYRSGDVLDDGTVAAGDRYGLFPDYFGSLRLTTSAIKLIDATIAAALAG